MKKKRKKVKQRIKVMSPPEEKTPTWDQVSILCMTRGYLLEFDPGHSMLTSYFERPQYVHETIESLFTQLKEVLEKKVK
jgi:hypothetical protein